MVQVGKIRFKEVKYLGKGHRVSEKWRWNFKPLFDAGINALKH
jgi:hypothetical protein